MDNNVNLAIQVLPLGIPKNKAYALVDTAIAVIQRSGLKYEVSAFETVVEGSYPRVLQLLTDIQEACKNDGANELLINMKLQRNFEQNIAIEDKTGKYR